MLQGRAGDPEFRLYFGNYESVGVSRQEQSKYKEAIEQLPPDEQTILASRLRERDWKVWDEQIERDFSADGRGMPLLAELEREIAEGKTRPMEEGFAERRKSRR